MQAVDATCPGCGKPRNPETCYPNKKSRDGLQRLCRKCDNAVRRKNHKPPPRRAKPPCGLCADQSHRVVGMRCFRCGLPYSPEPPVSLDTDSRRESAFASLMTEG